MGRFKKPTKGRKIKALSVPIEIDSFFDWLKDKEIERSPYIVELISKSVLFKQYLKEQKIEEEK